MEHLTAEEMLAYAGIKEINRETEALHSKVTKHIMSCAECAEKLRQMMYVAEFAERADLDDFRLSDILVPEWETEENEAEIERLLAEEETREYIAGEEAGLSL